MRAAIRASMNDSAIVDGAPFGELLCRRSYANNVPRTAAQPVEMSDVSGLFALAPPAAAPVARFGLGAARFAHLKTQHPRTAIARPLE